MGGGAPLDTGKLIALKITHDRPLVDYDDATGGDRFITAERSADRRRSRRRRGRAAKSGAPGVVTLEATGRKTVIFSPHLLAKVAILDPELTRSLPPRVTAATGFDALTHCLEAYCSHGRPPDGRRHRARRARALRGKHLARAVQHGDDLTARGGMMKAAMMGAVAFQKGLGACHSLAHPLSSEKGLHHGLANALCLPAVVDWNASVVPERMERVRTVLDPEAKSVGEALRVLRASVDLPHGLRAEGVTEQDIQKLADKAFEDACHRAIHGSRRGTTSARSTSRRCRPSLGRGGKLQPQMLPEKKQVLIVDDEPNLRKILSAQLSRDGYDVLTAEDGEAGLAILHEHHIDLVVTDLKMPKVDGMALLRQAHAETPTCPS